MKKFEYKVISCFFSNEEKTLNKLGEDGWELVGSYCLGIYLILKREK